MAEDIDEKPMTVRHIREVLIPAMEEVFATKEDIGLLREEFVRFKDEILTGQDKILKDLTILITEKEMGYHQKQKERKLWAIMIEAMQKHKLLSLEQIEEINKLEVF